MNFLVISNNRITILIREDKEDKERKKEQKKKGTFIWMEMRKRDNEKNVFIGANMGRILNKKLSISR